MSEKRTLGNMSTMEQHRREKRDRKTRVTIDTNLTEMRYRKLNTLEHHLTENNALLDIEHDRKSSTIENHITKTLLDIEHSRKPSQRQSAIGKEAWSKTISQKKRHWTLSTIESHPTDKRYWKLSTIETHLTDKRQRKLSTRDNHLRE